jgi:hypothetical protein
VTLPIPPREQRDRLPLSAVKWLLGADPEFDGETGSTRNGGITRWRYLVVRKCAAEDWAAFQRQFWAEHCERVVGHHIRRHPGTRPDRWWEFSAPGPRRKGESEYDYLERHGLLLPSEQRGRSGQRSKRYESARAR